MGQPATQGCSLYKAALVLFGRKDPECDGWVGPERGSPSPGYSFCLKGAALRWQFHFLQLVSARLATARENPELGRKPRPLVQTVMSSLR